MKEKLAVLNIECIKFIPEYFIKNSKLVHRKGDILQKKGLFKKKKVAEDTVWDIGIPYMHDVIVNTENSFYIEHDEKLYYKAYVKVTVSNDYEIFRFNSNEEALEFYNKLVTEFNLKEINK